MMRIPAVWTTNLAAVLFGFGLYAMFVTVPQFAQTPVHVGYGFGASVTKSGIYLLPFAVAMLVIAPVYRSFGPHGRLEEPPGERITVLRRLLWRVGHFAQQTVEHTRGRGLAGDRMASGIPRCRRSSRPSRRIRREWRRG